MALMARHFIIIAEIIQSIGVMIGVALTVGGIFQLKKYGEMRSMMSHQMTLAGPLMMIVAGSALLSLPTFIRLSLLTFLGQDSPLQLSPGSSYSADITPFIIFVRVIGVGSFIRGIVLLSGTGHQGGQPGTTGKALTHIFAGILAVHVLGTYELLKNIFGF